MNAMPEARSVDAGRGVSWWGEAWTLFTRNVGMWIVLGLILIVALVLLGIIPLIGSLAAPLLVPAFVGGWLSAARKAETGAGLEPGDLFAGFKTKAQPLLALGALLLLATLLIGLVMGALGFGGAMGMMRGGGPHGAGGMVAGMSAGLPAMLAGLVLGFAVAMAFWFAPALVMLRDVPPVDALKASFAAAMKNIVPFLLFGVIYLAAATLASLLFGLGWIVLVPLVMLTAYVSYKDVFGA
ncbi:BPSS1780 family membrane protein [Piscinibacter sp.]|uniref:BPSS1780 family membrane protein n=1 Tax=Piscinibacter sp. TaxID=1903157 RepID=UPI002C4A471D|nr:BPSS1780 family membrane protein [Albitalea sp.]HUG22030.1 BPSS1780 family membrane protein [Albitalea sp.]